MVPFKLFNKQCNDLMRVGYVHEKPWKLNLVYSGPSAVFTQAAVPSNEAVTANTSLKHLASWGFLSARFGNQAVGSDLMIKFKSIPDLSITANLTRNLITTGTSPLHLFDICATVTPMKSTFLQNKISVFSPHLEVKVNPFSSKWSIASTSGLLFGPESKLHFGGEASGPLDMKYINLVLGVTMMHEAQGKAWTASLIAHPHNGELFKKLVASVHCKSTAVGSPEVAVEATHYLSNGETPQVLLAGKLYLSQKNDKNTNTVIQAKLTHDAKLAVALSHKISDSLTTVFGTQIDNFKPETMKHGIEFKVSI